MHTRIHSLPVHPVQLPINCTGFQFGHKSHASDFSSGKGRGKKKSNSWWLAWMGVNVTLRFASISPRYSVWKPSKTSSNCEEVHHRETQSKPAVSFVRTPSFPSGWVYGLCKELRRYLLLMENADLSQRKTAWGKGSLSCLNPALVFLLSGALRSSGSTAAWLCHLCPARDSLWVQLMGRRWSLALQDAAGRRGRG